MDGKLLMTRIGMGSQDVVLDELKPGLYIGSGLGSKRLRFVFGKSIRSVEKWVFKTRPVHGKASIAVRARCLSMERP